MNRLELRRLGGVHPSVRHRAGAQRRDDNGFTLIEMLVAAGVVAIIVPVILLAVVSLVRGSSNVHNTMTGVQQDEVAGDALLQYLHGATVILPGSNATTLMASILLGVNSTYTAQTATLEATLQNSSNPNVDGHFVTSLTPLGGQTTNVGTFDALNSPSVFDYYYNNPSTGGISDTSTPTNSELSEIVAVSMEVKFLAGPHVPAPGYQSVRTTNFDTTIYLQNAAGSPAPSTTITVTPPSNPQLSSSQTVLATVSPVPDGGTISFSVTLGGAPLSVCTSPVAVNTSNGEATCVFTPNSSGTYSVTATYSGTSDFQPSTSSATTFIVPYSTVTAVSASGSSSGSGTNTKCTITATATVTSSGGTPNGTVNFSVTGGNHTYNQNGVSLNSSGVGSYTFTGITTGGSHGATCANTTYSVTANYPGNATYSASQGSTTVTDP